MTPVQEHPAPSFPAPLIQEKKEREPYDPSREVFVFSYKKGHAIISMHFQSESLATAVKESKEFARVKRCTWIGVTPFLRDIIMAMKED